MKKFSVTVLFNNGQVMSFETNTNIRMIVPVDINGGRFLVTEEQQVVNVDMIEKLDIVTLY